MRSDSAWLAAACALTLALLASPAPAARNEKPGKPLARQPRDAPPLAIVGGIIHPVVGADVVGGTLLLEGGRIRAILPAGRDAPAGMARIDATGRHVYPGLVAASASNFGLAGDAFTGGGDAILGRPVADSFDPWASEVELAASGGITSAVVWAAGSTKGSLAGRAAVLKTSPGEPRDIVVKDPAAVLASPRLLTAGGRRDLEERLDKARGKKASRGARGDTADVDVVAELAARRLPLVVGAGSAGRILSTLEVARALDLEIVIADSTEAWAVAAEIADAKASVVQSVRTSWGTPRANRRVNLPGGWAFDAIATLTRAGVPTAACPASDTIRLWGVGGRDLLDLPMEAAFAQRAGLSAQEALEAITIVPARIFGVERRVGSLEPGKDADVVIADGDILDYRTFVRTTIVGGHVVYRAEESRHWKAIVALRDATKAIPPP